MLKLLKQNPCQPPTALFFKDIWQLCLSRCKVFRHPLRGEIEESLAGLSENRSRNLLSFMVFSVGTTFARRPSIRLPDTMAVKFADVGLPCSPDGRDQSAAWWCSVQPTFARFRRLRDQNLAFDRLEQRQSPSSKAKGHQSRLLTADPSLHRLRGEI